VRYLNETGMNAVPLKTQFVGDDARDMLDEESEPETEGSRTEN
jgi:hypothetical protein